MDKSWMTIKDRMSPEYRDGVKKFVDFAMENASSEDAIRCPCMKCMNTEHHINIVVAFHLVQNGIAPSYKTWVHHGEPILENQENVSIENRRDKRKSVGDYTIEDEREDEDDLPNLLHEYYMATIMNDDELNEVPNNIEREDVQKFDKLLKDAHRELYPGCKFTLLSFVIKLLHVKVLNKWSNKSFDALLGLQERIVLILCKMEKIFPPAFFDVMVHLAIHLPREAMLGGPVQYRWMYPIERFLGILKGYVTNRAYPEGSISEAYIVKECLTFCSMYLGGMETVFNRAERNVDGGGRGTGLEVFKQNVRPFGLRTRASTVRQEEIDMAHWFVLSNSVEIQQYLEQHENQLKNEGISDIAKRQQVEFPKWFKEHINQLRAEGSLEATDELWSIANGPRVNVNIYSGCISNGVRFHTKDRDSRRKSQNSGVVAEGDREGETIDFYGNLCRVWELNYMLEHQVVLFQCEWYKTGSSKQFCSDPHCISINVRSRWYKNDPFVLPSQVKQVFYVNDTKLGDNWKVVERIQHRGIWDIPEMDDLEATAAPNDAFQQDETTDFAPMVVEDAVDVPLTRNDIDPEIIPSGVVLESQNEHYEDIIDDEEEESMGEFSEDEENELPWESDSDIDPDIEP